MQVFEKCNSLRKPTTFSRKPCPWDIGQRNTSTRICMIRYAIITIITLLRYVVSVSDCKHAKHISQEAHQKSTLPGRISRQEKKERRKRNQEENYVHLQTEHNIDHQAYSSFVTDLTTSWSGKSYTGQIRTSVFNYSRRHVHRHEERTM